MTSIDCTYANRRRQDDESYHERKRKYSTSPAATLAGTPCNVKEPSNIDIGDQGSGAAATPLSKNQQKKLLKKQRWEDSRESRRAIRREKLAAKRTRQRKEREEAKASPQNLGTETDLGGPKRRRNNRKLERQSKRINIKCIVDCSFDNYMIDKEVASLGAQVSRCYSDNRVAAFSMNLWITCVDKRLRSHLSLMHGDKWRAWRNIKITDTDYELAKEDVDSGSVIYLSSDSENTLETLDEGKTYIVGGIVDKNRYKGLCFSKAVGQGLKTAKLPIGEYIKMTGRITLTTNQVVEIMLGWLEMKDWKNAFERAIPMRKKIKDTEIPGEGVEETGENDDYDDGDSDEIVDGSQPGDLDLERVVNTNDSVGSGDENTEEEDKDSACDL
ncbi:hypothetical protein H072_8840 [Dactylellina haptotyla CBS 200.50]|uniref:tRNA (guanine(9)-N1)-methyltransferase n=1 Tax=Dactylellina haptotyla (strain CBS 200.50) TaxID=1284197 RepID=S8A385_DACHA|nr:hypothetical protein H072_8840 [Dactylellina haptotyla CBS 200.50]